MLTRKLILSAAGPLDNRLLAGTILAILGIQVAFLIHFNINWDEFHFLSLVFEYSNGTLSKSLQTFHVHLFSWMSKLDWDELRLVLLGRTFMLVCELLTLGFIYLTARKFTGVGFALFGVLSYLASGFVLMQGTSFRADPMITAMLMSSIYLLIDRPDSLWKDLVAAIAIALAFVISIKSIFYAPPLLAALIWRTRRIDETKHRFGIYIGLALGVSIAVLIFYMWHRSTLSPQEGEDLTRLDSIFSKVLLDTPFWPQRQYFLSWITASWPQMLLMFAGFYLLWKRHQRESVTCLKAGALLALPILSIFFYRNAYPYFFPFIVAPSMVAVSIGAAAVAENVSRGFGRALFASVVLYMLAYTLGQAYLYSYHDQDGQRKTIAAIHSMFPKPTPYIDRNSMIASFPKCGPFMSSWGMENYRHKGKPVFEQVLEECQPKFLIANAYQLAQAMRGDSSEAHPYSLFDQDAGVLRSSFIHHWGAIWVAGKSFDLEGPPIGFRIPVEAIYTVESSKQIILDGQPYDDGDHLFLSQGSHVIESAPQQVALRIGRDLPRPDYAPDWPIYFGFLWNILNMIE